MSKCKGCGKEITWGTTVDGKIIPLDVSAPVYAASPDGPTVVRSYIAWVSHFATCSRANDFSGSRKKIANHNGDATDMVVKYKQEAL